MENYFYFSSTLELGNACYLNTNVCWRKTYSETKITNKHYWERENWFRVCLGFFLWASKEFWGKTLKIKTPRTTGNKNWKREKYRLTHQKQDLEFRNGKLGTSFKAKFKIYSARERSEQKVQSSERWFALLSPARERIFITFKVEDLQNIESSSSYSRMGIIFKELKNHHTKTNHPTKECCAKICKRDYFYLVHQCLWIRKLAFLSGLASFPEDAASAFAACTPGTAFGMCKISVDMSRHCLESCCSCSGLITYFLVSLTWTACSPITQPVICWGNSLRGLHLPTKLS